MISLQLYLCLAPLIVSSPQPPQFSAITKMIPLNRVIDSDGDGIPDVFEDDGFSISGGRGVGCHVVAMRGGGPTAVLLLMMLVFGLGIRRYRRN